LLPYVGRWTRRHSKAAGSSWRPPSASGRVTSGRGFIPLCSTPYETGVHVLRCNLKRQLLLTGRFSPCRDREARTVVTSTVNGRFPAGELTRRAPQLFATSAMAGGAEAHPHIAPPKSPPPKNSSDTTSSHSWATRRGPLPVYGLAALGAARALVRPYHRVRPGSRMRARDLRA
jgi:hypothetical protein